MFPNYDSFINRHYDTIGFTFGSLVAEIITLPIATIKTNLQTSHKTSDTTYKIANDIYYHKGIKGFYNAVLPAMTSKMVSSGVKYALYSELKYYRNTQNKNLSDNMINGCIVGFVSPIFIHPIEVISARMQNFQKFEIKLLQPHILYGGLSKALLRNTILYTILFPFYDYNMYFTNNNIVLSCIMTCMCSTLILQPLDYLRTLGMAGSGLHNGRFLDMKQDFIKNGFINGTKILYRGYPLNFMSAFTHFTTTMICKNYFTK